MNKINKDTLVLMVGVAVSSIGDWLNTLALMSLFVNRAPNMVVLLMLSRVVPGVLLTPFISGVIDRINKKTLLIILNLFQGVMVFFIPSLQNSNLYILLLISLVLSAVNSFIRPSIEAIIPAVNEKEDLTRINSLFGSISAAISVISPAASGIVLVTLGKTLSFYIDSLSFFIFGSLLFALSNKVSGFKSIKKDNIYTVFKDNLSYAVNHRVIKVILLGLFLSNFTLGVLYGAEIIFFDKVLHINSEVYGLFVGIVGIGILLGAYLINKLKASLLKIFYLSTFIMGAAVILFSFNTNIVLVVVLLLIEGFSEGLFSISGTTLIQKNIEGERIGGVLTFKSTAMKLASLIALIMTSVMLNIANTNVKLVLFIAGVFSCIVVFVYLFNKKVSLNSD